MRVKPSTRPSRLMRPVLRQSCCDATAFSRGGRAANSAGGLRARADECRAGEEPRVAGLALEPAADGTRPTLTALASSRRLAIRCVVSGRVQGVYYRAATVERASRLALRGWVRNLPDGRVEAVAAGRSRRSRSAASWLWEGPPAARVDSVQVEEWTGAVPKGFAARADGGYARYHFVRRRSITCPNKRAGRRCRCNGRGL